MKMVRIMAVLCFCFVLIGATIKTAQPKECNVVAGPFVSNAGNYIYEIVEEVRHE